MTTKQDVVNAALGYMEHVESLARASIAKEFGCTPLYDGPERVFFETALAFLDEKRAQEGK